MNIFKLFVLGLYYFLGFLLLIIIGEFFYPGTLGLESFSALSLLAIFLASQADTILNLGSISEDEKK
ncbi:MAG TPA: hypothetical protein VFF13_06220 [archaeon]|nr:hypothetical protein [archaeon]